MNTFRFLFLVIVLIMILALVWHWQMRILSQRQGCAEFQLIEIPEAGLTMADLDVPSYVRPPLCTVAEAA